VIYNNESFYEMNRTNPNNYAMNTLSKSGVQVRPAPSRYEVTHQKSFTIDNSSSIIMTYNLEPEYFNTTRDFGIITTDINESSEITRVFDADWNNQSIIPSQKNLVWSPVNSRDKIIGIINNATSTLDMYAEEINDPQCIKALNNASDRGVKIRLICANLTSNGENANLPAIKKMTDHGIETKVGHTLYIHAKMILTDYQTSDQGAYIGSENFGYVSLDKNRELGILISNIDILNDIESIFMKDWDSVE
jgi:phosphatidylserine/phosphatidylglycerophosphate/cardiolipin synthase-like enzyme